MAVTQSTFWKGLATFLLIVLVTSKGQGATAKPSDTRPSSKPSSSVPRLAGINLAGIEFGAQINGLHTPNSSPVFPPDTQISHFTKQNVNLFRVPVAWDILQSENNAALNQSMVASYRQFIEKITSKGAYAIVDLHSYGRYKGKIVGEETSPDVLVSLWTQLGDVFKDNNLVMLGISNEPHNQDINKWASTVQQVVTAVRNACINNIILLPGIYYTSMNTFPKWYMAMKSVKNPDGSFTDLIFEVHRYLDSDNSGRGTECVASHADEVKSVTELLKPDNRQVLLAEVGGTSTVSCQKFLAEIASAVAEAFPTFVGFAMWSAGSFDEKYRHVTTVKDESSPTGWKDQKNWLSIQKFLPTEAVSPSASSGGPKKTNRKTGDRCRA